MNVANSLNLTNDDKKDIYKKTLQYITDKGSSSEYEDSMACNWCMDGNGCGYSNVSPKTNKGEPSNYVVDSKGVNKPQPTSITLSPKIYQDNKPKGSATVGVSTATSSIDPVTGKYVNTKSNITYYDPVTKKPIT